MRLAAVLLVFWTGAAAACGVVFDTPPPAINRCEGEARARVAFVGDVLLHGSLQRKGYAEGWASVWGAAVPVLSAADIAVANLEGPVAAGRSVGGALWPDPGPVFDGRVHTSYPIFNYHASVLAGLRAVDVDIVSTANNHGMDRGPAGAEDTLTAIRAAGLEATGTVARDAPRQFAVFRPSPVGVLAFIACSFSTNGMPDPARQTLLCYRDRTELLAAVRSAVARPAVSAVIVLPHWGIEYAQRPDAAQRTLARELVQAGAALVVGTHPHTVQGWEDLAGPGGVMPVAYSTGNFVSGQGGLARETGMLAWAEFCPAPPGRDLVHALHPRSVVERLGWVPLRMVRGAGGRSLATVTEAGADGAVEPAAAHIERLVPGRSMGARLDCPGEPVAFEVALQ